jgi:peptidoglycan/LPS O-acetylase OafA/YrhL
MEYSLRRYDIDWLRVIAIAMLLIYHTAIGFQSWGLMIGFITNKSSWDSLWIAMSMMNIWRIPLLFFVSGMGVYFALQKRDWKQLIGERSKRILLPFIFGVICIVPIHLLLLYKYYGWNYSYKPSPSHLWFLANIFIYTIILLPLFIYLKKHKDYFLLVKLRSILATPFGLIIVMMIFIAEAIIIKPYPYELYAMTTHGFTLGLIAFICGYLFIYSGKPFWQMICRWRWVFITLALSLYLYRSYFASLQVPLYQISIESSLWIYSVFAFGHKHLNRNSKALSYLSQSAYPIYIIHMIFIYLASYLFFPLDIDVRLKYLIVLVFLFGGSFVCYEFMIRRFRVIRPLFGLQNKKS